MAQRSFLDDEDEEPRHPRGRDRIHPLVVCPVCQRPTTLRKFMTPYCPECGITWREHAPGAPLASPQKFRYHEASTGCPIKKPPEGVATLERSIDAAPLSAEGKKPHA